MISLVIPTYNEETNIDGTIKRVLEFKKLSKIDIQVIISDDGSTDRTRELLQPYLSEIRLLTNLHKGKANAVREGVLASDGEKVFFTDADLSTPIENLYEFSNALDEYDVVIASRELGKRINEPIMRHLMGRVFNSFITIFTGLTYKDTQCGFKGFRKNVAQDIFNSLVIYGPNQKEVKGGNVTSFDVEILYIAKKRKYSVKEIAITWTYKESKRVSVLKDPFKFIYALLQIKVNSQKKMYNPSKTKISAPS